MPHAWLPRWIACAKRESKMPTKEEIIERVAEDGIEFISLQFTDILGVVKSVTIPAAELKVVLEGGQWFDGSSVSGFARIAESDMYLVPDLDTYAIIPWNRDDSPTARLICDVYTPTGEPFEGDPRYVLKRALAEAGAMGVIGGVFGLGIGWLIAENMVVEMSKGSGWQFDYIFPSTAFISAAITTLFVSQLAALYPVRRAAGMRIVQALQHE